MLRFRQIFNQDNINSFVRKTNDFSVPNYVTNVMIPDVNMFAPTRIYSECWQFLPTLITHNDLYWLIEIAPISPSRLTSISKKWSNSSLIFPSNFSQPTLLQLTAFPCPCKHLNYWGLQRPDLKLYTRTVSLCKNMFHFDIV